MELAIRKEIQPPRWVQNFWRQTFRYLDDLSLARMGMVSKFFRALAQQDGVRRPRFKAERVTPPEQCADAAAADHRLLSMAILLVPTTDLGSIVEEAPVVAAKHLDLAVMLERPDNIIDGLLKRLPPEADLSRALETALRSEECRYSDWTIRQMAKRANSVPLEDLEYAIREGREDRTVACLLSKVHAVRSKTLVYVAETQRSKQCVEAIWKRLPEWELKHVGLAVCRKVHKQVIAGLYDQLLTIGATSTYYAVLRVGNHQAINGLVRHKMEEVYSALEQLADQRGYSKELVEALCANRPLSSDVN